MSVMLRWRRTAVLLLLAIVVTACGDDLPAPDRVEVASLPTVVSPQLDVLFQIDDTSAEPQFAVGRSLPALLGALSVAGGQLPDLHVGVVTSDLGTTGSLDDDHPAPAIGSPGNGGCAAHGKDGLLQLSGAPVTDAFLIDEADGANGRTRNYQGDLAQVLATMLQVGAGGCGFEQPLAAMRRAFANPMNAGFRRPDANLLVVVISDEDDCSVRDPALFGPDSAALGPLTSFRCTRFGITCDQPLDEVGPKTGCHAAVGSPYIDDVAGFATALRARVADPAKLVVASLAGDPTPVAVEERSSGGAPVLALAHSCTSSMENILVVSDPGVRIAELVDMFASHGVATSGCASDLSPQLAEIARVTKQLFGIACLDATALAQPLDCEAREVNHVTGTSTPIDFTIEVDAVACFNSADHLRVVPAAPATPSPDTHVEVRCRLADPG